MEVIDISYLITKINLSRFTLFQFVLIPFNNKTQIFFINLD